MSMVNLDFDKIIGSVMADGATSEEIAAAFTEALNKVSNAKKQEKKDKDRKFREDLIKQTEATFKDHYTAENLTFIDVAALLWLCIVSGTTFGCGITDPEELVRLSDFLKRYVGDAIAAYNKSQESKEEEKEEKKKEKNCGDGEDEISTSWLISALQQLLDAMFSGLNEKDLEF